MLIKEYFHDNFTHNVFAQLMRSEEELAVKLDAG